MNMIEENILKTDDINIPPLLVFARKYIHPSLQKIPIESNNAANKKTPKIRLILRA
jgi:hypothetical protein